MALAIPAKWPSCGPFPYLTARITASDLPPLAFGFFLVSQDQGFVPNLGGSAGNLCIGGNIGRYVGPGQIMNSGPAGTFSLTLDVTNIPLSTGFVAAAAGDAFNFQSWHRDMGVGSAASNLTNGLEITFQ